MNKILVFLIFIFSSCSVNGDPVNDFHYAQAKTNIKNVILQDQTLRDLDCALNTIYKKACELSPNSLQIRDEQKSWLGSLDNKITIINADQLKYSLSDLYEKRILELLQDGSLRTFFLNKFINAPLKYDSVVSIFAIMSLIEATFGENDWYNFVGEIITHPMIMPISNQTIIVALLTNTGAYRQGYTFFKIYKTGKVTKIEPYYLPQLKTFPLTTVNTVKNNNYLIGNFNLTKKIEKYLLEHRDRPSSYEGGDSCIFQIDASGIKIINEWYSCDLISVNKETDLKEIAIKKIQRPTLVLIRDANIIHIYNITYDYYDGEPKSKLNKLSISVNEAIKLGLNIDFPAPGTDLRTKDLKKEIINKIILKQIDRIVIEIIK